MAKSPLLFGAGTEPCFVSVCVCASAAPCGTVRRAKASRMEAAWAAPRLKLQPELICTTMRTVERTARAWRLIEPGLERHGFAHHVAAHLGRALDWLERLEHGLGGDDVEGASRTRGSIVTGGMLRARLCRVDLVGRKWRGAGRRRRQLAVADRASGSAARRSSEWLFGLRPSRAPRRPAELARGHIDLARSHIHGAAKHLHEQTG